MVRTRRGGIGHRIMRKKAKKEKDEKDRIREEKLKEKDK
jgi:hypothetical protein